MAEKKTGKEKSKANFPGGGGGGSRIVLQQLPAD